MAEIENCPACGALPCDWVQDPHGYHDFLIMVLADIRIALGVNEKPMLSELPKAAADAIQSRDEEIASLRLDVATQEALQDSAYKAGLKAGRNFGEAGDEAGYQRAMASTEHVAELQRIHSARAALEKRG